MKKVKGENKKMDEQNTPKIEEEFSIKTLEKEDADEEGIAPVYTYQTHDGHKLTEREDKFIGYYIITGNPVESADRAGYFKSEKDPKIRQSKLRVYAKKLMNKSSVRKEIAWRTQEAKDHRIADGHEVMAYFTRVMRGEIKDQFGLDAPLSERTAAARELAKRLLDNPVDTGDTKAPSINIKLIKGN